MKISANPSSSSRPKESVVSSLQDLPPTCFILVMDNSGCILVKQIGASQCTPMNRSLSSHNSYAKDELHLPKALPMLATSRSLPTHAGTGLQKVKNTVQFLNTKIQKQFQQVAPLESKGTSRRFTEREIERATDKFSPLMVIGHSSHSIVYRANLKDGQVAAVKVLKITNLSREELLQEVDILSGLNHEHIVHLLGYCYSKDMQAVVYNLLQGSLKQNLKCLRWKERMNVAVGVAKALRYLHRSCSPPIIHRDVKSSNILLSHHFRPQLSDFGTAMVYHQPQKSLATREQHHVVGTFGYMAPEYVMYGKVNEKTDVYSYGVVLLELITGKAAIQKNMEFKHGSLVLWARSLLSHGLSEQLIDPNLNEDYNNEEMQRMMTAAQLCLRDSSSRRPSITKIIKLLEEPQYWVKVRKEREECNDEFKSSREPRIQRCED
ncbi:hypothetical protein AQUCO_00700843v1 [Aquilegia coerulea]|uniref:Protein kinase domain-containing protein n=1 Tax=Aquilegia coerulea TaxID=218851 RepID=A0A2G5ELW4_AQUCA|nr:hypothetical protein AQUCO_00700843v1 [Aquilegia coerulea]